MVFFNRRCDFTPAALDEDVAPACPCLLCFHVVRADAQGANGKAPAHATDRHAQRARSRFSVRIQNLLSRRTEANRKPGLTCGDLYFELFVTGCAVSYQNPYLGLHTVYLLAPRRESHNPRWAIDSAVATFHFTQPCAFGALSTSQPSPRRQRPAGFVSPLGWPSRFQKRDHRRSWWCRRNVALPPGWDAG